MKNKKTKQINNLELIKYIRHVFLYIITYFPYLIIYIYKKILQSVPNKYKSTFKITFVLYVFIINIMTYNST